MGFFDVLKAVTIPALIAAVIYALLAYVLVPIYRNHRARYSQYLPLETLTTHTSGLRSRISGVIQRYFLPAHMRWREEIANARYDGWGDGGRGSGSGDEELYFGEEEGESMVGFDVGRRERGVSRDRDGEIDSERRLSRDLEEGFRDSDDEEDEGRGDDRIR